MEIIELYEIIISNSRYLVVIIVEEQVSSVHKSRFNNQYEPSLVKPQSIEKNHQLSHSRKSTCNCIENILGSTSQEDKYDSDRFRVTISSSYSLM